MTAALKVRHALAEALGVTESLPPEAKLPATMGVKDAARLLGCTPGAIYVRRNRGQLPTPIQARPLRWRTADLLAFRE